MGLTARAQFAPRSDLGQFIPVVISPAVRMGVEEVTQLIEDRAKEMCPVDTGALQASIRSEIRETGATIVGEVAPHTDYAAFVEYGTGQRGAASPGAGEGPYSATWPGMAAQPFMRPALEEGKTAAEDVFASHLRVALK